jgi:predicted MFS family arabinose efflux permease
MRLWIRSVADIAPADRRAESVGIVSGGASVGWVIGPLLGGFLYDRWRYEVPFGLSIALAVLALLVAALTVPETHASSLNSRSAATPAGKPEASASLLSASRAGLLNLPGPLATFAVLLAVSFGVMFAWAFIEPQLMFYAPGKE